LNAHAQSGIHNTLSADPTRRKFAPFLQGIRASALTDYIDIGMRLVMWLIGKRSSTMKPTTVAIALMMVLAGTQAFGAEGNGRKRDGEMRKKLIEKFDKDGDGQLNEAEREAAKAAMEARRDKEDGQFRDKLLKRFDADGDGKISDAEREAAKEARPDRGGKGDGQLREKIMEKFDKNGDGELNEEERAALKAFREEHQGKREGMHKKPDGKKNGRERRQGAKDGLGNGLEFNPLGTPPALGEDSIPGNPGDRARF
jgi:Ca2+-binding EF-hand superfamily protein